MSDVISAAPVAAAQTTATSAASAPVSNGPETKTMTMDEWNALNQRLNSLSAAARRVQESATAKAADPVAANPAQLSLEAINARQTKLEQDNAAKNQKFEARNKNLAIRESLSAKGLEETDIKILSAVIQQDYGAALTVDEDGNVYHSRDDLDGGPRPVAELVEEVFGKFGKRFQPPASTPRGPRGNVPQPNARLPYHQLSSAQRAAMTPQQQREYIAAETGS